MRCYTVRQRKGAASAALLYFKHCLLHCNADHGFLSEVQWAAIEKECDAAFAQPGKGTFPPSCQTLLTAASATAGKFYVYDIYVRSSLPSAISVDSSFPRGLPPCQFQASDDSLIPPTVRSVSLTGHMWSRPNEDHGDPSGLRGGTASWAARGRPWYRASVLPLRLRKESCDRNLLESARSACAVLRPLSYRSFFRLSRCAHAVRCVRRCTSSSFLRRRTRLGSLTTKAILTSTGTQDRTIPVGTT
jgi:hypothetical protein